jgi:NAD dependent epimerase/dehydratase family enzyme
MKTPYIKKIKRIDNPTPIDLVKIIRWIWMDQFGKMLRDYAIDRHELAVDVSYDNATKDITSSLSIDVAINFIGYHINCVLVNDDKHTSILNAVVTKTRYMQ